MQCQHTTLMVARAIQFLPKLIPCSLLASLDVLPSVYFGAVIGGKIFLQNSQIPSLKC